MTKSSTRSKKITTRNKTSNSSMESVKEAKIVVLEEYLNMNDFQKHVVTNFYLERLAKELIEWATHDRGALKLSPFFKERGVSGTTLDRWRKLSPAFDEAYVQAKEIIGDRRELGVFNEGYPDGFVSKSMAIYDKDWREVEEWRSKLKENAGQSGDIKVVIEQCPNSDKVPLRADVSDKVPAKEEE